MRLIYQDLPVVVFETKARGSGDIVAISKAKTVVGSEDLKARAVKVLDDWSQEEAEKLIVHVGLSLDPGDRKFGVFRHGGSVGLTRVTYDKPWFTELLVRAMKEKCPDAEFSALYLSVNTPRDVHVDSNNLDRGTELRVPDRGSFSGR